MREQEVKIRIEDTDVLIKKLGDFGYTEKNKIIQRTYRCWRPDRLFSRAGIFPRTRTETIDGEIIHTFTVKSRFKSPERGLFEREECEMKVENAEKMAKALAIMGMSDQRILEKERRHFEKKGQEVIHVFLDRFCFGTYLEVEGAPGAIDDLLMKLGIDDDKRLGMAYWDVYWHYCKNKGIEEERDLFLPEMRQ